MKIYHLLKVFLRQESGPRPISLWFGFDHHNEIRSVSEPVLFLVFKCCLANFQWEHFLHVYCVLY